MLSKFFCTISSFLLLCFLVGCQSQGVYLPLGTDQPQRQHTNRLIVLDKNIRNNLIYINAKNQQLPRGQIRTQINIKNRLTDYDLWADVLVEFQDKDNITVDRTEWIPTFFPAAQITTIQGSSLATNAVKHVVMIKNLRRQPR